MFPMPYLITFCCQCPNDVNDCRGGALAKWFEAPVLRDNKQTKQNIPGLRTPSGLGNLKKLMVALNIASKGQTLV